ncbi:hypothetical protein [Burkholderia glumae]|uniref:hypothetical protein n=1 Tax=Burkholderia glumae TaxID=337 RepID=UPI00216411A4|nr:hypothetical protein [Burkholderia glumae]
MDAKKLKPFDLEAAKRGEPLVTRDGRAAHFIAYVPELGKGYQVIARIDGLLVPHTFFENGSYDCHHEDNDDLFMAPRKVTRWVNLYNAPTVHHLARCAYHYPTEEDARRDSDSSAIAIAIPVEIEV